MQKTGNRSLLITTMKNEGPYIIEWVAFQKVIGFDDILAYTNDCDDGTDVLLDRLTQMGQVTHVRNKVLKRGPHKSALKYAFEHPLYKQAEWVFVCDIDEFLNIREGAGRLEDLIARFPGADAIPVPWRMYSNAGLRDLPDDLTLNLFTDAEPDAPDQPNLRRFVKTLFRRSPQVERLGLHTPIYSEGTTAVWSSAALDLAPDNNPSRPPFNLPFGPAELNHYAVRTLDAYMIKRDRGRANHINHDLGIEYWQRLCQGGVQITTIQRHLPALRAEIDRLMADPILRRIHDGARDWHRSKLTELMADPGYVALREAIIALGEGNAPAPAPAPPPAPTPAPKAEPPNETPIPKVRAKKTLEPPPDDPYQIAAAAHKEVANAPEDLATKAPKRHRLRMEMLALMPKAARCAEVGTGNGGFSAAILEITQPSELVMVDPWDMLADDAPEDKPRARRRNTAYLGKMRANVTSLYGKLPNVTICQGFSETVLASYPDDYFDWVYIDGNHMYDNVRRDVELAFAKVKRGGIIAGDDFFWKHEDRLHVREAVFHVLRARGKTSKMTRLGQQFMITVEK